MKAQTIIAFFGMLCIAAVNSQATAVPSNPTSILCKGLLDVESGDAPPKGVTVEDAKKALELIRKYNTDYNASPVNYATLYNDAKAACDYIKAKSAGNPNLPVYVSTFLNFCSKLPTSATGFTEKQAKPVADIIYTATKSCSV
jgi:hypothetical protein